ncbi:hypothetical protein [Rhodococcus sp. T7]|uniref:hypothetical protein n=1 Tax=Rhodococcus sp. T7 TaxID=627444 RepID=UPI001359A2B4|nr:hypothetical protein [Rhodococcus sp. T7]KAF0965815.1 hypothetical protein MLGJGCBP_01007 [Rhodococcus sp. T7]
MRSIRTMAVVGTTALMMFLMAGTASASPPSPDPIWYSWFPTREMGDAFNQFMWVITGWMTGYGYF